MSSNTWSVREMREFLRGRTMNEVAADQPFECLSINHNGSAEVFVGERMEEYVVDNAEDDSGSADTES